MRKGTVIARSGLSLRRSPKTGKAVKTLRRGSGVEILGEETWLRVCTGDGTTGWVLGDLIEHDPAAAAVMPEGAARAAAAGVVSTAPSDVCVIDLHRRRWAGDLIRDVGLSPAIFPEIRLCGARLGSVTTAAAGATGLSTECVARPSLFGRGTEPLGAAGRPC